MSDWTAGSRVKIDRANEHVDQFIAALDDFAKEDPYLVIRNDKEQPGRVIWRVNVRKEVPPRLGAIAGDVVHNLRSALDVLVHQLVLASDRTPTDKLAFPFYGLRDECDAASLGEIKRASEDAVKRIKAHKPYKRGNTPLWLLQQIDNADKHEVLTPVAGALLHADVDFLGPLFRHVFAPALASLPPERSAEIRKMLPEHSFKVLAGRKERFCPLKDGALLLALPSDIAGKMDENPQFTFSVAFPEGEMLTAEPVIPLLRKQVSAVKAVVNDLATVTIFPRRRGGQRPSAEE